MKKIIPLILLALTACSQENKTNNIDLVKSFNADGKTANIITTAKNTDLRLSATGQAKFGKAKQALETENAIFVNPNNTFQTFIGIGGAITDASAEVFAKLSAEKQEELLNAYYGNKGNNYNIIRTSIHSCDFSSSSFTYINEGDKDLTSFSIDHDKKYRLPMIKRAIEKASESILFYASPWSPPAFMKDNKNMLHGGKLLPEYYDTWARYYAKFIKAYEKEGIPVWGLTIQNEPMAVQIWESCIYTAEEERDFLKNHLGPILEKEGLGDKNIVVWDHNRDLMTQRANTIFDDAEATKYAWGTGFHWYETWRGGKAMFDNEKKIQEAYPDKKLLFTEGCNEKFDPEKYQYWPNAERYGDAIINDFNCGTVGWTDWNILLDQTGGPNHVGNLCFAPIHADTQKDSLIYTPSYFYLGHFSRYILPGAKRVSNSVSNSFLQSTSFINEDGSLVNVVMNSSEEAITYKLYIGTATATEIEIPARAIQTIIL
ncbi:glycoside hydrolase family 30 beta sandwich domain-containing protein [Labilibaculum sp.]|uniref:glycoside hydrolase family 30 protein n=1 Tax=Labilibaculum sp. TaxID=2060723 RepID=UPI00356A9361